MFPLLMATTVQNSDCTVLIIFSVDPLNDSFTNLNHLLTNAMLCKAIGELWAGTEERRWAQSHGTTKSKMCSSSKCVEPTGEQEWQDFSNAGQSKLTHGYIQQGSLIYADVFPAFQLTSGCKT